MFRVKHLLNASWLKASLVVLIAGAILLSGAVEPALRILDLRHSLAILAVQPVVLISLILQGIRHTVLIDTPGLSYFTVTKAVTLSQGLNLLLPARLSEILKATYLRNRANVPMSIGVSAVLLERTVDLIILTLLGVLCLLFFFAMVSKTAVFLFAVLTITIIGVALWGRRGILSLAQALPWPRVGNLIERTHSHFASTLTDRAFAHGLWLGLLVWGLSFLNIHLILDLAGSVEVGIYGALLVFVCTTIGGAVPALPGGLGTYEAAAVFALTSLGYTFADALALAVTIHVAQLVLPIILALIIMLTERIGLWALVAELRATARQAQ
ncbi:lysylphosphatidylglycerol synthase transmembrane domain-containing protein [Paralcaligenes ginsengisoli]